MLLLMLPSPTDRLFCLAGWHLGQLRIWRVSILLALTILRTCSHRCVLVDNLHTHVSACMLDCLEPEMLLPSFSPAQGFVALQAIQLVLLWLISDLRVQWRTGCEILCLRPRRA